MRLLKHKPQLPNLPPTRRKSQDQSQRKLWWHVKRRRGSPHRTHARVVTDGGEEGEGEPERSGDIIITFFFFPWKNPIFAVWQRQIGDVNGRRIGGKGRNTQLLSGQNPIFSVWFLGNCRQMDVWMSGWLGGRMDAGTDGWMDFLPIQSLPPSW